MTRHIPVTVLGGYLGAGKTTLINHLLADDHGVRVAVLVNDFGAINVDASLIADKSDETISLANGCVCCSIADDLGAALDVQTARSNPPEHIVLEASGVAEPARIAAYAGGWPGVRLDSVVTVLDAETVKDRAADKFVGGLVRRQIASADLRIINKADLIDDAQLSDLHSWLETETGTVDAVVTAHGRIDWRLLISSGAARAVANTLSGPDEPTHHLGTRFWPAASGVDRQALGAMLRSLPTSIHRIKGHVRDGGDTGQMMLVQAVGRRWSITPASTETAETGLVAIGSSSADLDAVMAALTTLANRPSETQPSSKPFSSASP